MTKMRKKRLILAKQTIRTLAATALGEVHGGLATQLCTPETGIIRTLKPLWCQTQDNACDDTATCVTLM
jgi:hypothetical protein